MGRAGCLHPVLLEASWVWGEKRQKREGSCSAAPCHQVKGRHGAVPVLCCTQGAAGAVPSPLQSHVVKGYGVAGTCHSCPPDVPACCPAHPEPPPACHSSHQPHTPSTPLHPPGQDAADGRFPTRFPPLLSCFSCSPPLPTFPAGAPAGERSELLLPRSLPAAPGTPPCPPAAPPAALRAEPPASSHGEASPRNQKRESRARRVYKPRGRL